MTHSVVASSEPEETTAGSRDCECMSRTSDCSIHPSTPAAWISSQGVFLAKMYPLPAKAPDSAESGQDSGVSSLALLAKYDPDSSSWRTAQCSLVEDSTSSLAILPRWGSMRSGRLYQRPKWVLPIAGSGSGSWPTQRARDHHPESLQAGKNRIGRYGMSLPTMVKLWPTPTASDYLANQSETPEAWSRRSEEKRKQGINLQFALRIAAQMWPTPTVCGNYNRKGASGKSVDGLATAVSQCATPTARDWKSGKASQATMERNSRPLSEQIGGSLNSVWVAWLMSWPMNWFQGGGIVSPKSGGSRKGSKTVSTSSKPLAMDKCPCKPRSPGDC